MIVKCANPDCQQSIPSHETRCPTCGADAGFPNVRDAKRPSEAAALNLRYESALKLAASAGTSALVDELANAVDDSRAVMCKTLREVVRIAESDDASFVSFHQLVSISARTPGDGFWDMIREAAESLLFPYYFRYLQFAALSITNLGPAGYGPCSLTLRQAAIKGRASLLEQNAIKFVLVNKLSPGQKLPAGHRAVWETRSRLAVAKLAERINISTVKSDLPKLLLDDILATDCDLIEVQVYGPIQALAIERIVIRGIHSKVDRAFAEDIKESMSKRGVSVEVS